MNGDTPYARGQEHENVPAIRASSNQSAKRAAVPVPREDDPPVWVSESEEGTETCFRFHFAKVFYSIFERFAFFKNLASSILRPPSSWSLPKPSPFGSILCVFWGFQLWTLQGKGPVQAVQHGPLFRQDGQLCASNLALLIRLFGCTFSLADPHKTPKNYEMFLPSQAWPY